MDQQSARKVAVGLLESTKEEEETMMYMYDQKIGGRSCREWASMTGHYLSSMTSIVIQQHEELHKAVWQPWMTGSLP